MRRIVQFVAIVMLCACAAGAAESRYYVVPVNQLEITEGQLPERLNWRLHRQRGHFIRVTLDAAGEAYLQADRNFRAESRVAVRTPDDPPVSGRIFFPAAEGQEAGDVVSFQIPSEIEAREKAGREFLKIKGEITGGCSMRIYPARRGSDTG